MEEKLVEIYYDHYKDTFENIKTYIQRRNYYTITILCLLVFLSFQITNPEKTVEISNQIVKKNVGDVLINFKYITHILLFALFWVVIMYFQILFVIEKHYSYIHEIEEKLTEKLKPFEILREGKNYLDHYPWLSSVVDRIYTILFPLTLVLISVAKWFVEKNNLNGLYKNWNFWIDTILLLGIMLISLLYLSYKHFNDFKKKKTNRKWLLITLPDMFKDNEKNGKALIIIGICFTLFFAVAFIFKTGELTSGEIEPSIWGQFGDIVGGFVGTIVALVGVLLLFETLKQQRRANSRQQVETRFFELLKLHRDNVSEMQSKKTFGRKVFIDIKDEFHDLFETVVIWYPLEKANISEPIWKKNVIQITYLITFFGVNNSVTGFLKSKIKEIISDNELYAVFNENCLEFLINEHQSTKDENKTKEPSQRKFLKYDGYQSVLGHYFRHLFQTVTYINDQIGLLNYREKYDYIKTLRAQLSTHEQAIFLYNSISSLGEPWELSEHITDSNKKLITKYNFIKNIPIGFTRQVEPKEYFPDIFFETDDTLTLNRIELEKIYT